MTPKKSSSLSTPIYSEPFQVLFSYLAKHSIYINSIGLLLLKNVYPFFIEYGHGEKLTIKIEGEETKINK
jgi:hypothetical protein